MKLSLKDFLDNKGTRAIASVHDITVKRQNDPEVEDAIANSGKGGKVKYYDRSATRYGYNPGQDKAAYDPQLKEDKLSPQIPLVTRLMNMSVDAQKAVASQVEEAIKISGAKGKKATDIATKVKTDHPGLPDKQAETIAVAAASVTEARMMLAKKMKGKSCS